MWHDTASGHFQHTPCQASRTNLCLQKRKSVHLFMIREWPESPRTSTLFFPNLLHLRVQNIHFCIFGQWQSHCHVLLNNCVLLLLGRKPKAEPVCPSDFDIHKNGVNIGVTKSGSAKHGLYRDKHVKESTHTSVKWGHINSKQFNI